jgi:hypothetical protein
MARAQDATEYLRTDGAVFAAGSPRPWAFGVVSPDPRALAWFVSGRTLTPAAVRLACRAT